MKFQLMPYHRNVSDEDLISDLLRVKAQLNKEYLTGRSYQKYGKYSKGTYERRFGTWNKALRKAGISINIQRDISDDELFKNLEEVWIRLGRQPKYEEFRQPLSRFSVWPYEKRFGGWIKALEKFVDYINSEASEESFDMSVEIQDIATEKEMINHKTKREVSDRLRFRVLMRDGFTCRRCGRSPVKERDVELHVDHILPWSKGGETVIENLETKCTKCNLGKGNAFNM